MRRERITRTGRPGAASLALATMAAVTLAGFGAVAITRGTANQCWTAVHVESAPFTTPDEALAALQHDFSRDAGVGPQVERPAYAALADASSKAELVSDAKGWVRRYESREAGRKVAEFQLVQVDGGWVLDVLRAEVPQEVCDAVSQLGEES